MATWPPSALFLKNKKLFSLVRYVFTLWPFQAEGVLSLPVFVRLSGHLSVRLSIRKLLLVRTIPFHSFGLKARNLHQTCIMGYSQLYASWDSRSWYWKWGSLTLTFEIFWPFRLKTPRNCVQRCSCIVI